MHDVVNFILADTAGTATKLTKALTDFIGPILLAIIGIVALRFLFNRQVTQFIIFIVIAALVALLFYYPGVIKTLATTFADSSGLN